MKSKKLMAALSALTLGATMMGGMAMTAGAYCVHDEDDNCVADIGFYTYWRDNNNDGTINWNDAEPAPHGMYDVNTECECEDCACND